MGLEFLVRPDDVAEWLDGVPLEHHPVHACCEELNQILQPVQSMAKRIAEVFEYTGGSFGGHWSLA